MIEQYFHVGALFSWTKPPTVFSNNDGTMVVSANPAPPALTYLGAAGPNITALPLGTVLPAVMPPANTNVPYVWCNYVTGRTGHVATSSDVLTGFMSGCQIVTWIGAGGRNVGHLGTVDNQAPTNTLIKNTFWNTLVGNSTILGFNPAASWTPNEGQQAYQRFRHAGFQGTYQNCEVLALVTGGNRFYSIALLIFDAMWNGAQTRLNVVVKCAAVMPTRILTRAVLGP